MKHFTDETDLTPMEEYEFHVGLHYADEHSDDYDHPIGWHEEDSHCYDDYDKSMLFSDD